MSSTSRGPILWTFAISVAACAPQEAANDPAADAAAIEAVREAEGAAGAAGDAAAFVALMTDDVIALAPNEPPVVGKAAAEAWLSSMVENFDVSFQSYDTEEVEVSGDLAFERYSGVWTLTPKAGGDPVTETVKGIHILRRQADGSWRIARDIWNTSDPLPEM